jgi:hypothetical protein
MQGLPWRHDEPGGEVWPLAYQRRHPAGVVAEIQKEWCSLAGHLRAAFAHFFGVAEIVNLATKSPSRL